MGKGCYIYSLKMTSTEGQGVATPSFIRFSWTSEEGDMVRPSGQPEPITAIIPVFGQVNKPKQASTSRKENLLVDELPSVLREADLQSISQEYSLPIVSFKLFRCHGDLRADHFFDKTDLIMVYEEQLNVGL